jgi:hypothetical protein
MRSGGLTLCGLLAVRRIFKFEPTSMALARFTRDPLDEMFTPFHDMGLFGGLVPAHPGQVRGATL